MAIGDGVSAIASLAVTFGGFSPTAMDGVQATREQVERAEAEMARKREAALRQRELERARTSEVRKFTDEDGSAWSYAVIDDEVVRIVGCESEALRVCVPGAIEGKPVRAIGPDACARNEVVREIVCDDGIEFIGSCAFRLCPHLRRIVLPANVGDFSPSWLQHCGELQELVLPGHLDKISFHVFDNPVSLLVIGPNVREVEPGAFEKAQLSDIVVSADNPFIMTDGAGVYTRDGSALLALARPLFSYDVATGCRYIAKKALYGKSLLERVTLPDTVQAIDEFAFSHSGLTSFTAPASLAVIGEKAFFCCRSLARVSLNDGLREIGNDAFSDTAITSLRIPGSIDVLGTSVTAKTGVVHSGPGATLEIGPGATPLFLDGAGGLYRREDDGIHLVQLVDTDLQEYSVFPGTRVVNDHAFALNGTIRSVDLPEGVQVVQRAAFRVCGALEHVGVPDSLREVGDEAFMYTSLREFRIPAGLASIGKNALVTAGAQHTGDPLALRSIEVDPANPRFFMHDGMLCERVGDGVSVVVFTNTEEVVELHPETVAIAPYAFMNARGIRRLALNARLKSISHNGLAVWCWIDELHVEVAEPVEGRTSFDFRFPDTQRSVHEISIAIGGSSWVNVPDIMAHYDNSVINAHDYNSRDGEGISAYEQALRIVARLRDPILLTKVNRGMYERVLRLHIADICVDIARNDDRACFDDLLDLGFLNEDNLEEVIAAVGKLQDASMTGHLLEAKRRRFNRSAFDFDL